ncbi:MAG: SDR family oxidoreductase [Bacteroidota bacterium]
MKLEGKTALITGASSGIGKSLAYLLASHKMNVALVARSKDKLQEIAVDIEKKYSVSTWTLKKDLSKPNAGKELYEELRILNVKVDLLINNAGFGKWGGFEEFTLEEYQNMVQLNITALMDLTYLFLPDLKQRTEAGVINVASTAALLPVPFASVYAATKFFVLGFSEGLYGELDGTNVKVHCLCPGGTATNFNDVASSGKIGNSNGPDQLTPDEVAQQGIDAFLAGKHYHVTGRKLSILMTRFMPRKSVVKMVAKAWKKRITT